MNKDRDYYQLLHVQPDAPREIIRASYRTLMQRMRMHPDLGGDSEVAAALNEAYAVLIEPEKRAAYDRARTGQPAAPPPPPPPYQAPVDMEEAVESHAALSACAFCAEPTKGDMADSKEASCGVCGSPLQPLQQLPMDQPDRRALLRIPKNHPLVFFTHWPQPEPYFGRTDDVSLTGLRLRCTPGLAIGQIVKIDTQLLRAVARVVRAERPSTYWEVGVEFITLSFTKKRGSFFRGRV